MCLYYFTMSNVKLVIWFYFISFGVHAQYPNNACKTIIDYYLNITENKNCFHNPDVYLSVPEIIQRQGYRVETHTAITQDGYILTLFRIPQNKSSAPVAFIQHGLATSSIVYVDIGKKSLAFTLADNGYDVWLGNFRGTEYSNKHTNLKKSDERYWNFSFHEHGVYDLPCQLNYVYKTTQQKIFYIGYSMGSTAYLVYNSQLPEEAQRNIRLSVSLAPVAIVQDVKIPGSSLLPKWHFIESAVRRATKGVIDQKTPKVIATKKKLCLPYPFQMNMCLLPVYLVNGIDIAQLDPETLPVVIMQDIDSIVIKTFSHYFQLVLSGLFQQFDYREENYKIYGSARPPQYNLSKINVPNYFIRANKDVLATKTNVELTFTALSAPAQLDIYVIKYEKFNHLDFIAAKDAKKLVYDHIVNVLQKHNKR